MLSQFVSSNKPSTQLTKSALGMIDGANDDASVSDISGGSVKSDTSGSSTPTPPQSSPPQSQESPHKTSSLEVSRPTSPIPRTGSSFGSRTTSPISFGYPYHQSSQIAMFSESPVPAAIHG